MCDPATIGIGLALLAGGTKATNDAQADRREAMDDAALKSYLLERGRQKEYSREKEGLAEQVFAETAGVDPLQEQMEQAAEERLQMQRENEQAPELTETSYISPAAGATTHNVQQRLSENREETGEKLDQRFGALARLRSLGDAFNAFELFRQPIYGDISAINSFSRESSAVAPFEAEAAAMKKSNVGKNKMLLGQIAAGIGSAMIGSGAMGGATAGAGSTTGATTGATAGATSGATTGAVAGGTAGASGLSAAELFMLMSPNYFRNYYSEPAYSSPYR